MELAEVIGQLAKAGNVDTKRIFITHGAKEPLWGVKVADLTKIKKKIKLDTDLAIELWNTGNSDARYLAGMIVNPKELTKEQLQQWGKEADWYYLSEYAVAGTVAQSDFAHDLIFEWIDSGKENLASAGWGAISFALTKRKDAIFTEDELDQLLVRVAETLHVEQNRVRYTMNGFVIALGVYSESLREKAIQIGNDLGKVQVDVGKTSCKVPYSPDYIKKGVARKEKKAK